MNSVRTIISRYLGVTILAGAMLYSLVTVLRNDMAYEAPDVTTIRICHWQLEAGFREALQTLIEAYEQDVTARTGEKIQIIQVPISEKAYRQYVNTGLIGNMAPDIIEKGKAKTAEDPTYVARFFLPLGELLSKPNPYNANTPLEGVPWRETFFDGMQGAYDQQLLDYYHIPFSMFTVRIYYNKDLYRTVLGRDNPPASYADFMAVCEQITTYARESSEAVVPMAASRAAQGGYFSYRYETPFLDSLAHACDIDYDGQASVFETYLAAKQGLWRFDSPEFILAARCMTDIASHFQKGWSAAQRDDALFMFAQRRAVMIASGSWDAQSIIDQTKDFFEIGVFGFPMPTDHPVYGQYVKGPISEAASRGGIPWAINKRTPHPDVCIDFLQYCTTAANNGRFNARITWLPVVKGVTLSDEKLLAFRPIIHGYAATFDTRISTAASMLQSGNKWSVYAGQMAPEESAAEIQKVYDRTAEEGYRRKLDEMRRSNRNLERIISAKVAVRECVPGRAIEMEKKLAQLEHTSQALAHAYYVYHHQFELLQDHAQPDPGPQVQ